VWVGICSTTIFLTVPVARSIQRFVYNNWGEEVFLYLVSGVLSIGFVFLLYFLIFKLKVRSLSRYIWLFIIVGLYTYLTLRLKNNPTETIHFLEYGLLGFFLFKALSHHIKDKSIYLTATFFALLIGTFDEILQWITPQRFWDFRDAILNGLSGGLFELAVFKVIQPKIISEKINLRSIRIFTFIFIACLITLGLCASNTPQRVAYYTERIPWLFFLQKEEPMSEFGDKYMDPEIGTFYSRLTLSNLQKTDEMNGEQYSKILNESAHEDYTQFLKEYNPITNPFMHELRVHIFRRDSYFEKAKAAPTLDEKEKFSFIAYKENLILEKYFSQSIKNSVYRWKADILQELGILNDKAKPYKSPVSANLFTFFSERTMWVGIFVLISSLIFISFVLPFIEKQYKAIKS
jgi:VanZ family protein